MKRFAWESTPLVNVTQTACDTSTDLSEFLLAHSQRNLIEEVMEMHKAAYKMKPVEFHKYHLGKQNFCWNGAYRFWVWEGEDWRVFASNIHGTSFEVRDTFTTHQALKAWDDYRRRVMLLQFKPGTLVHVYGDDQLVKVEFPDPRYGGHYMVTALDGSQEQMSVSVDNIKESEIS